MGRYELSEWAERTMADDEDDMDEDESLATELHSYVQFRLSNMIAHPDAYGKTREAIILQLMLIVEFALLTHPESGSGTEASFEELLATFPDATLDPQRVPEHAWTRRCAVEAGNYIKAKILAVQAAHRATCPHCGPGPKDPDRMAN